MLNSSGNNSRTNPAGGTGTDSDRESLCRGAAAWIEAGYAVIPIRPDGSKAPMLRWAGIADGTQPPPTLDVLTRQIMSGQCDGIAVVPGIASGGAEVLEIEGRAVARLDDIVALAEATGVSDLLDRLREGCVEESPSGGLHFAYRVSDGEALGNTILACRPYTTKPKGRLVLAETRGQGGYMICHPSFGRTHETGRPYRLVAGAPTHTPLFTVAERNELHRLFRSIDEMPIAAEHMPAAGYQGESTPMRRESEGLSPGDDFNSRATWDEVLPGWTRATTSTDPRGGVRVHWRRPGKSIGTSATTGGEGDWLYVFSTSTQLPSEKALSKFAAYTYLNHDGDFAAAAADLAARGFGSPRRGRNQGGEIVQLYEPFPVDSLPAVLKNFVEAAARAASCDDAHVALPAIAAAAAAIGTSRQLKLKGTWPVLPTLWTATIGESGSKKSVGSALALGPIEAIESRNERRYQRECRDHEREIASWERQVADWKKTKCRGPQPEKPLPPASNRVMVDNTTIEALAPLLKANPRGLLLAKDELKGWLASFDRYTSNATAGSDEAHWLSMYNGRPMVIDRKTGKHPTIHVPRAAVSITGNIPPGILKRSLNKERRESGLAARFLMACPPKRRVQWNDETIPPQVDEAYRRLFEELYKLHPLSFTDGELQPMDVEISGGAKAQYIAFYNDNNDEQMDLVGDLAAVWSKIEETAARLALVFHMVRSCAGEQGVDPRVLDETSMASGIRLAQWFKNEAMRVYAMMAETDGEEANRRLAEWVDRNGGYTTAREVQQKCRWLKEAGRAEKALQALVDARLGDWETTGEAQKGRPGRRFMLADRNCLR